MTREEHIEKAEELLAGTWEPNVFRGYPDRYVAPTPYAVALAQVHATLALTAEPATSTEAPRLVRAPWWRRAVAR